MTSLQAILPATTLATVLAAVLLTQPALAADLPEATPAPAPAANQLAAARTLIESRQWAAAAAELKRVDARHDADWNNLMGYVLRKSGNPDLTASERHYEAALRIDPHHRNALEYSGELYLMKSDLAKARTRLAALAAECKAGCPQYNELKEAIARYRANGNKYVAQGW